MRALASLLRRLIGAPGFTLAAVGVTALGVGATTGIFSVVDAVLLDPLSHEEDRVVVLYRAESNARGGRRAVSLLDVGDWRRESTAFEALGGFGGAWGSYAFGDGASLREFRAVAVTPQFFEAVGVEPVLGRGFLPHEIERDSDHVVVVSHRFWQTVLGGRPDVLGERLDLEVSRAYTVVGVMPRGFEFPNQADLWMPARLESPMDIRAWDFLFVAGKLAPGVTAETARAELELIDQRLWRETREGERDLRIGTMSLSDVALPESLHSTMRLLSLAVALLGVVTGTNLLGLCLVRALARRREITIRAALGATGFARVGGVLAEIGLVCALGGVFGALLARSGLSLLVAFGPGDVPRLDQAAFGPKAAVFAFLLTLGLFVAVSAASVYASSRWAAVAALAASAPSAPGTLRAGKAFSVFQIAATVYLVVGAVLLAGSLLRLSEEDLGYDPERLLLFEVDQDLSLEDYETGDAQRRMVSELLPRFEAIPGVRAAASVATPPMGGVGWWVWFVTEDQGFGFEAREREDASSDVLSVLVPPNEAIEQNPRVNWQSVSNDYFRTMGISLLQGRTFDARDHEEAPRVVIVGKSFADRQWPGESALGKRMLTYGHRYDANGRPEWQTIVGVVDDVRYRGVGATSLDVYVPLLQSGVLAPRSFALRTAGDPLAVASSVRAAVQELNPKNRVDRVRTMTARVSASLLPWRFNAALVAFFAGASLALAAAGVFSLLAQNVSQRTRELGIRLALGATGASLQRLVLGLGLRLLLWGVALGLGLALATSRILEAHLYGMTPTEPAAYAIAALVVVSVALLACSWPAATAARTHPTVALRHE